VQRRQVNNYAVIKCEVPFPILIFSILGKDVLNVGHQARNVLGRLKRKGMVPTACTVSRRTQCQKCLLLTSVVQINFNRGPAKGYIEALENRLLETEQILLRLLPTISSEHLSSTCFADGQSPNNLAYPNGRAQKPNLVFPKRVGIEYWSSFPLNSVQDVRQWQEDRFQECDPTFRHRDSSNGHMANLSRVSIDQMIEPTRVKQSESQLTLPNDPKLPRRISNLEQGNLQSPVFGSSSSTNNPSIWSQVPGYPSASVVSGVQAEVEAANLSQAPEGNSSAAEDGIIPANFKREFIW
jgi:hypothetical protein